MRRAIPVLVLLLLGFGGYIKGLPLLSAAPVDITVMAAGFVLLVCVHRWFRARLQLPRGKEYVLGLWWIFLLGWPSFDLAYSAAKLSKIYTLVLLCAVGALFILNTPRARRTWVEGTVMLGVFMAVLVHIAPNQEALATGRLAIEGSNTIGSGRGIGAAAVALATVGLSTRRHRVKLLALAVFLAATAVGSGSRGPVLAAMISVVVVAITSSKRGKAVRIFLSSLALGATAYLALRMNLVADRLLTTKDQSAEYRRYLWSETASLIPSHPFGIGWGQLFNYPAGQIVTESGEVQYPHNLFLEVFSEAGWFAGAALVAVLMIAFRRQRRAAQTPVEMAMLGLFVFYLLSAMVSGDVNDNRGVWIGIGAALVAVAAPRSEESGDEEVGALPPDDAAADSGPHADGQRHVVGRR